MVLLKEDKLTTGGIPLKNHKGQTAIEYLLLLGVIVAIVLLAMPRLLPRTEGAANVYFNRAANAILGKPNPCGDGICDPNFENNEKCCVDCAPICS